MNTASVLRDLKATYPTQDNFIQTVTEFLESITEYTESFTEADYARLERLLRPERIISFKVVWTDDAGKVQYNTGYRVQFNSALGPYKGGLRFDPSVNEDILKFLGFEQIFKNALTGLPLGGGKGGSDFNPKGKSDNEIRSFCRAFMLELYRHIGPQTDVPAGDIGVGGREIGYMYGMYKQIVNRSEEALTGKGTDYGGSFGRTEATGHGVVYFAQAMLEHAGESLKDKKVVVSGAGNVALYTARMAISAGAKVLTLSDRGGYVLKDSGFSDADIDGIEQHKETGANLETLTLDGVIYHAGTPWQSVPADIYMPCATQNEIKKADAEAIVMHKALAVIEGANMPSDLEAITVFKNAKLLYGPSKAANAGGVAVSGLEMSQNAGHIQWTAQEVEERLQEIMKQIHATCVKYGTLPDGSVDYVKGANIGGFSKVDRAMKALGW